MTIRATVRETGKGIAALRKAFGLRNALAGLRKNESHVKVGVLAEGLGANTYAVGEAGPQQAPGAKLTIAEIAAIHEFGTRDKRIPERSFMRSTFNANRAQYSAQLAKMLALVVQGRLTLETALKRLGLRVASDMQKSITVDGLTPPLALSTLVARARRRAPRGGKGKLRLRDARGRFFSRKHSTATPLVDTGQLVRAITYAVVLAGAPSRGGE